MPVLNRRARPAGSRSPSPFTPFALVALLALVAPVLSPARASGADTNPGADAVLDSLGARADSLSKAGDYRGAHEARVAVLERIGRTKGARSIARARAAVEVGALRFQLGLLDEADAVLREALAIYRDSLEADDPLLGNCLDRLGTVTHYRGRNQDALPILEEAVAIFEASGPDTSLAGALNNYSLVTRLLRMTDEATDAARRALAILMRDVPDHRGIPYVLNNLANLHVDRGDYATAEPLYRESIARRRTMFGPSHPQVATALSNLAHVLRFQGNEREAEALLREAWDIRKGVNEWHPDVGRSMMNLANCLREQERFDEAADLLAAALDIHAETLGEDHPSFARNLGYLANLHFAKRDYATARDYFTRTLRKNRDILAPGHSHIADNLSMIARCADGMDDPAADSLYRAGAAAWEERVGAEHAGTIAIRIHHANYLLRNERASEALALLENIAPAYETVRLRLQPGPRRARFVESPYRALAAAHLALGNAGEAWNAWERANGRVFFELLCEANGLPWTDEERGELARLNRAWDDLETRAATLAREAEADPGLRAERDRVQSELYRAEARYLAYRNEVASKYGRADAEPVTWRQAQKRMPPGVAIIGWFDPQSDEDGETAWVSLLRAEGEPVWRAVGRTRASTGAFATRAWSELLARTGEWPFRVIDTRRADELAVSVYAERIGPVEHELADVSHLVVIPGRAMSRVPIEALPDPNGTPLGERFTTSYASSGTTFLALEGRAPSAGRGALLVGAPVLAVSRDGTDVENGGMDFAFASGMTDIVPRAVAGDLTALRALPPLPAAGDEIAAIERALSGATTLTGADASEARLRDESASGRLRDHRWIHFATHTLIDDRRADGSLVVLTQTGLDDPLDAALSGAARMDGLLSAREVIRDWDLDAELVSLSSCRSALGVESPGDGFIGLSQAFFHAGARSVVVSLWSVDDRASSLVMSRFYEALAAGSPKPDALRHAKLALRDYEEDGERPYRHPAYWSAFVLHGAR